MWRITRAQAQRIVVRGDDVGRAAAAKDDLEDVGAARERAGRGVLDQAGAVVAGQPPAGPDPQDAVCGLGDGTNPAGRQTIAAARELGAIHQGATLEEAAASADLIYLAQPINGIDTSRVTRHERVVDTRTRKYPTRTDA